MRWRSWLTAALRTTIALVVAAGIGRTIWLEKDRLSLYDLHLAPGWLAASGFCYVAGLAGCAAFWWLAMRDRAARPGWASTLAAYYAGHLGKYVPGKGMVLVLRATIVRGPGVSRAVAAVTCLHETVLMMATGAAVAAGIVPFVDTPRRGALAAAAGGLTLVLGVTALPPVVRWGQLALRLLPGGSAVGPGASPWRTVAYGAALIAPAWLLMGLSLACVLVGMGEPPALAARWALLTAATALATVGGFVSLLPGGLGAREWILSETLGPIVGSDRALVAAVLLRVVWLLGELVAAAIAWIVAANRSGPLRIPAGDSSGERLNEDHAR